MSSGFFVGVCESFSFFIMIIAKIAEIIPTGKYVKSGRRLIVKLMNRNSVEAKARSEYFLL